MSDVKDERYAAILAMKPKIVEALEAIGLTSVEIFPLDLGMSVAIKAKTGLRWLSDEEFFGAAA